MRAFKKATAVLVVAASVQLGILTATPDHSTTEVKERPRAVAEAPAQHADSPVISGQAGAWIGSGYSSAGAFVGGVIGGLGGMVGGAALESWLGPAGATWLGMNAASWGAGAGAVIGGA